MKIKCPLCNKACVTNSSIDLPNIKGFCACCDFCRITRTISKFGVYFKKNEDNFFQLETFVITIDHNNFQYEIKITKDYICITNIHTQKSEFEYSDNFLPTSDQDSWLEYSKNLLIKCLNLSNFL